MIISYQWLLEYLPEPLPVDDLSRILTSIGLEVEATEKAEAVKGSLEGLVTGEVLTCEKHPGADKLKITTVDAGTGTPLHIVCGAPNVAAGQKVIVAPVGATVHPLSGEPFLIKKAKIRGELSEGMICAEDEIGLGTGHDGIMVLPEDTAPGTPANVYFNIPAPDTAIHIGLTPNRADAMSHLGVARDVCAWLTHHRGGSYEVKMPSHLLPEPGNVPEIKVHILSPEACARYAGIRISGVRVGPSPEWLQRRLHSIGVRSINNVVDITNFVLHEYGQPLHAFDAERIGGGEINVRFLPEGTKFVTLDEQERTLRADDLMICDSEHGLCIAGVFGGRDSGVTGATGEIFLESAWFRPAWIRRTSLHHGLRTDAAARFEKGVDMDMVIPALQRAAALILEYAGGNGVSALTDIYPAPVVPVRIPVTYAYINKICGKTFAPATVQAILKSLRFEIEQSDEQGLTAIAPSCKPDVSQPADIAEEILRIDGLDQVPVSQRLNISLSRPFPNDRAERERTADQLCGMGFQEIVTNSIINSKYYPGREDLVRMLNSLSQDLDALRPSMLESGLEVIRYNLNRKSTDLALFEAGKTYLRGQEGYRETPCLALWLTGNVQPAQWNRPARPADIYYLKGVIENLLEAAGIGNAQVSYPEGGGTVQWKWKNRILCTAFAVDNAKLQEFDIRQEVYFAEIDWTQWTEALAARKIRYREIPKFPSVRRDLALVLDSSVQYEEVKRLTEQLKLEAMQSFELFDVFESDKLGAGKKSYALSYTFRLSDRTLTDQETGQMMEQLVKAYTSKLNAQIRE